MKKVMAYVFAGVRTRGLSVLTRSRSVAAVPFAGKYRLIDFTLSNCVNSELSDIAVLAQYSPHSLIQHVGRGGPWDLNRRDGGVTILQPYERQEGRRWYQGTADALRQNLDVLDNSGAERVFLLTSELVYKMDYSWMLKEHLARGAGVTLAVGNPETISRGRYGRLRVDDAGRVLSHDPEDPAEDAPAFMGIYLFEAHYLREMLAASDSPHLFMDCLRPRLTDGAQVRVHRFGGHWEGIVGVPDYLEAHARMLADPPTPDLYDPDWRIYTRSEEMPPVVVEPGAEIADSLISNGSVIHGRVERSVLSPGVYVGPGAVVRDSVLLNRARVEAGAHVERAVLDKRVRVGEKAVVGGPAGSPSVGPEDLEGIAVVGKRAAIEAGAVVPPGSEIAAREITTAEYLESLEAEGRV